MFRVGRMPLTTEQSPDPKDTKNQHTMSIQNRKFCEPIPSEEPPGKCGCKKIPLCRKAERYFGVVARRLQLGFGDQGIAFLVEVIPSVMKEGHTGRLVFCGLYEFHIVGNGLEFGGRQKGILTRITLHQPL